MIYILLGNLLILVLVAHEDNPNNGDLQGVPTVFAVLLSLCFWAGVGIAKSL